MRGFLSVEKKNFPQSCGFVYLPLHPGRKPGPGRDPAWDPHPALPTSRWTPGPTSHPPASLSGGDTRAQGLHRRAAAGDARHGPAEGAGRGRRVLRGELSEGEASGGPVQVVRGGGGESPSPARCHPAVQCVGCCCFLLLLPNLTAYPLGNVKERSRAWNIGLCLLGMPRRAVK